MRMLSEKQKYAIAKNKKTKEKALNEKLLVGYRKIDKIIATEMYRYLIKYNSDALEIAFGYGVKSINFDIFKFFMTSDKIHWDLISADEDISERFKEIFTDKIVVVEEKEPEREKTTVKPIKKEVLDSIDIFE